MNSTLKAMLTAGLSFVVGALIASVFFGDTRENIYWILGTGLLVVPIGLLIAKAFLVVVKKLFATT